MLAVRKSNDFEYETLETGQRRRYGDSWYKYRVKDLADPPRDKAAVLELTALKLIGPKIAIMSQVPVKWPPVRQDHFQRKTALQRNR